MGVGRLEMTLWNCLVALMTRQSTRDVVSVHYGSLHSRVNVREFHYAPGQRPSKVLDALGGGTVPQSPNQHTPKGNWQPKCSCSHTNHS